VLITVLVLDLRPPELPAFKALLLRWATWLSYAVSYLFIAIVWANHHLWCLSLRRPMRRRKEKRHDCHQISRCRRGRSEGVLSRGWSCQLTRAAVASWVPQREPYVPGPHPAPGRSLPHHRARPARFRPVGHAGAG